MIIRRASFSIHLPATKNRSRSTPITGNRWNPTKPSLKILLWSNLGEMARKRGGHGGMDFIMIYRLLQTMHNGEAPDSDVYDAAEWSAPGRSRKCRWQIAARRWIFPILGESSPPSPLS